MNKLGYILMSIFCAFALCNCEKNSPEVNEELYFQMADYATKSEEVPYTAGPFGVYAYFTAGNFADAGDAWNSYPYMTNQKIANVEATVNDVTSTCWRAVDASNNATPYFWPRAGKLSFIAYSPYKASNSNMSVEVVQDGANLKVKFNYKVSPTEDLMYSDFVPNQTSSGANGVPILFHHALAKVRFTIAAPAGTEIEVIEAKISNIKSSGSYESGQSIDSKNVWTTSSNNLAVFDIKGMGEMAYHYVIPQKLEQSTETLSGQRLYLKCNLKTIVKDVDNQDVEVIIPFEKHFDLTSASLDAWEVNTIYNYTITVSSATTPILFTSSVTNWETGASTTVSLN